MLRCTATFPLTKIYTTNGKPSGFVGCLGLFVGTAPACCSGSSTAQTKCNKEIFQTQRAQFISATCSKQTTGQCPLGQLYQTHWVTPKGKAGNIKANSTNADSFSRTAQPLLYVRHFHPKSLSTLEFAANKAARFAPQGVSWKTNRAWYYSKDDILLTYYPF